MRGARGSDSFYSWDASARWPEPFPYDEIPPEKSLQTEDASWERAMEAQMEQMAETAES